jgi:ribose 5-phosphate isomerase RpiB
MAKDIVTEFLGTAFEGGRHQRRVDKLTRPDLTPSSERHPA